MILSKKIYNYLYIFFLVLIIVISEFSTNFAKAKTFVINNIEIQEKYDLNFNKIKVVDKAFKKAFEILISKILQSENKNILRSTDINQIKSFVEGFSLMEEKFVDDNLPNEDIEDFSIIRKNIDDIENYNFNEIFNKYNVKNRILLVLLNQDNLLKVFSKLNLENNEMFINKNFNDVSMKNLDQINDVILDLKNDFENKWKSLNEINTSIILPIRLSLDSNNILLSNNLENYLNEVDLISNYKIENFNSKKIIYKIIFNSTPDKFLKIMQNANFEIDTSKDVWKLQ